MVGAAQQDGEAIARSIFREVFFRYGILCDIADAAMGKCEITDERGRLVAKAASTCLVLRGDDAKGR
jgi:hypothetical protein